MELSCQHSCCNLRPDSAAYSRNMPNLSCCVPLACPHQTRTNSCMQCIKPHLHMPCDIVSTSHSTRCQLGGVQDGEECRRRTQARPAPVVSSAASAAGDCISDEQPEDEVCSFKDDVRQDTDDDDDDDDDALHHSCHHLTEGVRGYQGDSRTNGLARPKQRTRRRNATGDKVIHSAVPDDQLRRPSEQRTPMDAVQTKAPGALLNENASVRGATAGQCTVEKGSHHESDLDSGKEDLTKRAHVVRQERKSSRAHRQESRSTDGQRSDDGVRNESPQMLIPREATASPTRRHRDVIGRVSDVELLM